MSEHSQFEYDANFDKAKVIALAVELREFLGKAGISNQLWSIQPWMVSIQVSTSRGDLSDVVCEVYKRPEVMHVMFSIEPNTRVMLLNVFLTERWFIDERPRSEERRVGKECRL